MNIDNIAVFLGSEEITGTWSTTPLCVNKENLTMNELTLVLPGDYPKNLKVRLNNIAGSPTTWIDSECLRMYDHDLQEYLKEEFGLDFGEDMLEYTYLEHTDELIQTICFTENGFSVFKHDLVMGLAQDYPEDAILAGYQQGISLGEFEDKYKGQYLTLAAFAQSDFDLSEVPERFREFIDWEKVATDFYDQTYYFANGYVFDAC